MDIAEARAVLWPDKHHRPMGELFDSGFLYKKKLVWAAEHAADGRVREAAKLLLHAAPRTGPNTAATAAAKVFDLGVTLEQARSTVWPFWQGKGEAIGSLLDAGRIGLKDLAHAAETAWDDSLRKSAMALILNRLDQILKEPPPTSGQIEVVSGGESYAAHRVGRFTFYQGMVAGTMLGFAVMFSILTVRRMLTPQPAGPTFQEFASTPTGLIAAVIGILIIVLTVLGIYAIPGVLDRRFQRYVDDARRGQEGEDRVMEVILQALDGTWKVFRNVSVPGMKRSDIDIVLVGPPGVWALEVKNLRGEYRNIGDTWEEKRGNQWKKARTQPSEEARRHAGALGQFLKADGLDVFAHPAVVWANPQSIISVENPSVAVWSLERLPEELGNIWYSRKMQGGPRETVTAKLVRAWGGQRALTDR